MEERNVYCGVFSVTVLSKQSGWGSEPRGAAAVVRQALEADRAAVNPHSVLGLRDDPLRVVHFCGGNLVATGSRDKAVQLLDMKTVKPVMHPLLGHTGSVRAVLLSEERGLVLSAGSDLTIRSE